MKLSIISSLLLITIPLVLATSCTMDYQCGTAPYGQCSGSVNDCSSTQRGVAIDKTNNNIYYAAICRSTSSDNNVTVQRIPVSGGVPTNVFTEVQTYGPDNIDKVFTVVNGVLYFDRIEREPGSNLADFNLKSSAKATITTGPGFFEGQLDIANGASYTCQLNFSTNNSYSITRYAGIVGQTASTNGNKLYITGANQCGPIRRGTGSDLIFTVFTYVVSTVGQSQTVQYTTTFYKGTVAGAATLPAPLFTAAGQVSGFDIDSTGKIIVYGSSSGLFKREGATTTTLSTESVTGVTIYNNKIYYNNGVTIRSTNFDGSNTQTLIQPATGTCTCRSRFYGSDCQSCDGQVQWDGGVPSCVATNAAGVPNSCNYDYQCGNVPYSVCYSNTCQCRTNFTGAHCDQCSGAVTFNAGIPSCA